ncbi:hypothetical protein [Bartonella schoenbuchensis]|uniref:hypothetical protein n=1 Tax=Bartonella schoenbuchensis TaxID=165694 RepID=UPI00159EC269|nr:hypothetical protein [Bartonella schoenbuchensis]
MAFEGDDWVWGGMFRKSVERGVGGQIALVEKRLRGWEDWVVPVGEKRGWWNGAARED